MGIVRMLLIVQPDTDDFTRMVYHIAENRVIDRGKGRGEEPGSFFHSIFLNQLLHSQGEAGCGEIFEA